MQPISVTKYNTFIKQIFDAEELLHNIEIVGEVFGVSLSRQVLYFSLKDEFSSISCVCFYPQMFNEIKEGEEVVITGSPNYYQKSGKLSFNVVDVKSFKAGLLYQKFIELKERLAKQGIFDPSHKKPLPKSIKRIGVISSKDGAVIRDIINVAWRRDPSVDIVLYPSKVQGKNAEDEICRAIEKFDSYKNIDVIVVARGGGSDEDLSAFNTEKVAMAAYNAKKVIVSAVGHETDYTIIDLVCDLRAPTPSAAAELLTQNKQDKIKTFKNKLIHLKTVIFALIEKKNQILLSQISSLKFNVDSHLTQKTSLLEKNIYKFSNEMTKFVQNQIYDSGLKTNTLKNLSPYLILKNGYAKIEQNGKVVDKLESVVLSSDLEINFIDGKLQAKPIKKGE